ncbi:unnamed protein product [Vitrella brassicaformis CCMP3155]|uniref:Uncharacterized protein n=1 Tax=Vitrella brassicaformis (strain CCMP3155) TaxID=1169540 RepID=A0A0G4EIZ8_VITBC|nr:unnamed protein product [Vitrella brassicaformis CCMP3155]|mmetsp:Transcript_30394/g.75468  ORF Transcript_30394/g.75468 Transcript_30394/m.75468 type:complete len:133 (-) Transcript_30394:122-520(-)|eukprot:CEL95996.1 unnamed protein product [Vitrella brassicaformis CCMP3155]
MVTHRSIDAFYVPSPPRPQPLLLPNHVHDTQGRNVGDIGCNVEHLNHLLWQLREGGGERAEHKSAVWSPSYHGRRPVASVEMGVGGAASALQSYVDGYREQLAVLEEWHRPQEGSSREGEDRAGEENKRDTQ